MASQSVLMARVNRAGSKRSSTKLEPAVVYRGIKILPIYGRRSATAEALREALQASSSTRAAKQSTTKPPPSKEPVDGTAAAPSRRRPG